MPDSTMNAEAQAAVQQGGDGTPMPRSSSPRMDVLDIENIAGINLDMMRFANRQTKPVLQVTRTAVCQSYREKTVIDFEQGTVSQYGNEDMFPQSGQTDVFFRDDATVQITLSASDYQSGQLESIVQQMVADHQERRNALQAYFAGDPQLDDILAELDDLYMEGQEAAAASFANMVDCFWECRGQGGLEQRETVRSSVEALFAACEASAVQEEEPEFGEELLTLQELDSTAVSISQTMRSANLPGGRAQGVMRYRAAAAMQNIEMSRSLGQG